MPLFHLMSLSNKHEPHLQNHMDMHRQLIKETLSKINEEEKKQNRIYMVIHWENPTDDNVNIHEKVCSVEQQYPGKKNPRISRRIRTEQIYFIRKCIVTSYITRFHCLKKKFEKYVRDDRNDRKMERQRIHDNWMIN